MIKNLNLHFLSDVLKSQETYIKFVNFAIEIRFTQIYQTFYLVTKIRLWM